MKYYYYLYLKSDILLISRNVPREMVHYEMISRFNTVQDAMGYAKKFYSSHEIKMDEKTVKKTFHGISDEARARMREVKLGEANPNAAGLTHEHKKKISRSLKKIRQTHHPMENRKHRPSSKLQCSQTLAETHAKNPRRWVVGPDGKEYFILASDPIPPGFVAGRKRGTGKNK